VKVWFGVFNKIDKEKLVLMITSLLRKAALVLFGVVLFFVLLEAGLRLGGFVLLSIREYGNSQSLKQKNAYRILCLGESTTEGQYPKFLEEALNRRNIGIRFSVIDKGRTGTDTPAILKVVETYLDEHHPDMVVAMMGNNDQGIRYYQDIPESNTWFFRHCRVYRFGRILFMHLLKKIKQEDIYGLSGSDPKRKAKPEGTWTIAEKTAFANEISAEKVTRSDSGSEKGSPGSDPRVSGAKKLLRKDTGFDPEYGNTNMELGWLYLNQGKFSQAEDAFKKVIEFDPKGTNAGNAYYGLGRIYKKWGKLSEAEDFFKTALEINPKDDGLYFEFGWLYRDQGKFSQAEDAFKKAREINPKSDRPYIGLGWLYRDQGKLPQAEDAFKKALEIGPENEDTWEGLGRLYQVQGKFSQAEASFKKAIELNPEHYKAFVGLGELYRAQDKFSQAEDLFKKAIELDPKNTFAYFDLARVYVIQHKFSQFEDLMKKTIEVNPENEQAYLELGQLYRDRRDFSKAEDAFRKALELNPGNDFLFHKLGETYQAQGKLRDAENAFKKALEINPKNERALSAMASLYEETGKPELVKEYTQKVDQLGSEDLSAVTVNNYCKLKEILDRKGIKLVCVQYPMRNVEPLKRIFEKDEGVIFVDNEHVFKEAVKKAGYKEYFKDMFAGDFGHCTQKGNELLAQNIADVILREVFNK
jgi:tetratricopeptide (TPR) repeat protein